MARWQSSIAKIVAAYHEIPDENHTPAGHVVLPETIDRNIPWAYFDGATQAQGCAGRNSTT